MTHSFCANSEPTHTDDFQVNTTKNAYTPRYYCDYPIWYDDWYCRFNERIFFTADSMNDWLKIVDAEHSHKEPTVSGRIRIGWEPRTTDLSGFDSRFRLRIKLPALEDRVELLLTDEEDDINQQAVKAARNAEIGNQEETTIALQFKDDVKSPMSYRLGLGRGGQLYTRARYTQRKKLTEHAGFNYFSELHYYSGDKFGAEINGQYTYTFDDDNALEVSNSFRYRETRNNWFWRHEFKYLHIKNAKQSILLTAMVDGLSQPNYRSEQHLISLRYKQNVLRPWLFVEIEPYVLWLRKENFNTSYGVALRLEVHFPDDILL